MKKYKGELKQKYPNYKVLEKYITAKIKILHEHLICGYKWKVIPDSILRGQGCPKCFGAFNLTLPAITYLVYFNKLDIYKVGITNRNITVRFSGFPEYEIILIRKFDKGKEAKALEKEWISNLKNYLVNTSKLPNGNTETFRYE